ncbi:unnamed protein product [Effrenium voratum]|nr:unnamed protein product [Effrenium voratum]
MDPAAAEFLPLARWALPELRRLEHRAATKLQRGWRSYKERNARKEHAEKKAPRRARSRRKSSSWWQASTWDWRSEPWWSWEAAGKPGSLRLGSELPQPISRQLARWVKKSEAVEPVPRPKGSEVPRWRWRAVPEAQREEAKSDLKKWSEGHSGTSRPASVRRGHDTWQAPREDSRVPAVWRKKSAPPVGQGESVPRRPLDKEAASASFSGAIGSWEAVGASQGWGIAL